MADEGTQYATPDLDKRMVKAAHTYTHTKELKEIPVFVIVRFIRQSSTPKDAFEVMDCTTYHLDKSSVKQQLKSKPLEFWLPFLQTST